jgi:hypothetical protein
MQWSYINYLINCLKCQEITPLPMDSWRIELAIGAEEKNVM